MAEIDTGPPERAGGRVASLGWIAGGAGFLFFLFWPGLGLDNAQRGVAATTTLTAALWLTNAIPLGAASLIPAALMPLLGVMSAREVGPTYMHDIVLLFVGAFMLALGLERWGMHRRIALAIVQTVGTSPRRVVLGFMVSSAALSMWISNTATTLLMLPIALAVIATLEPRKDSRESPLAVCLLLGIAYSASIGGTATLVGTAPNLAFRSILSETFPDAPEPSFGEWIVNWFPLTVLFVPIAWFLLTRFLSPVGSVASGSDEERRAGEEISAARRALGAMTRGQILMSIMFFGTALLWVTRADLDLGFVRFSGWAGALAPEGVERAVFMKMISDTTVVMAMVVACFAIPVNSKRGEFLLDWQTAVKLPWEIILLFGGGLCIAKGFQDSGLASVLGEQLAPLLVDQPAWLIVLATALFLSFLTEITSNTATTFVLLPVAAHGAVEAGINPLLVMLPATIAASMAFMLPVATPPNAIVFSSRRFGISKMAYVGFWLNLVGVLLLTLIFEYWVRGVGGLSSELPVWAKP